QMNDKTAQIIGFRPSALFGRPFVTFVAKADILRFLSFLTRSLRGVDVQIIELDLLVNRTTIPVQISLRNSFEDGTAIHRMTMIDLSDVRKVERELQITLENWAALVQNAPDVIMTVDRSGRIVFVNRPVWGCGPAEMMGRSIKDYVSTSDLPKI